MPTPTPAAQAAPQSDPNVTQQHIAAVDNLRRVQSDYEAGKVDWLVLYNALSEKSRALREVMDKRFAEYKASLGGNHVSS